MLRIGFDAKRLFNNFTGLGNYSRNLLYHLCACFPEYSYYLYTPHIVSNALTEPFLDKDIFRVRRSAALVKPYWRSYSIVRDMKKDGVDLFHGLSHEIPFGIGKSGIRTVVTIHDLIFKVYPDTYPFHDRTIYDLKFRYSCRNADAVIAISESTRNDIIQYYGIPSEKIHVIPPAFDDDYLLPIDPAFTGHVRKKHNLPSEYMLYVGSITERKNLMTIIQAYSLLEEKDRTPLVIVGEGHKYKKKVLDAIHKYKLESRCIFIGNIHHTEELRAIYSNAMLFLFPSLYEGFGLPVMEALLCRTPVITSSTSSLPEAGGTDTCYVKPTDPSELAFSIRSILADRMKASLMAEKGWEYAQQFNGKRIAGMVAELYEKIILNP